MQAINSCVPNNFQALDLQDEKKLKELRTHYRLQTQIQMDHNIKNNYLDLYEDASMTSAISKGLFIFGGGSLLSLPFGIFGGAYMSFILPEVIASSTAFGGILMATPPLAASYYSSKEIYQEATSEHNLKLSRDYYFIFQELVRKNCNLNLLIEDIDQKRSEITRKFGTGFWSRLKHKGKNLLGLRAKRLAKELLENEVLKLIVFDTQGAQFERYVENQKNRLGSSYYNN